MAKSSLVVSNSASNEEPPESPWYRSGLGMVLPAGICGLAGEDG